MASYLPSYASVSDIGRFIGISFAGAAVLLFFIIRAKLAKSRKLKIDEWSQLTCPHCGLKFGEAAAGAVTENYLFDGGPEPTHTIRCLNCLRFFERYGNQLYQSGTVISADKLRYTPIAELDSFGSLEVICAFDGRTTREELEAYLQTANPRLLERIEFLDSWESRG